MESGPASRADGQAQGKDVFALINQKKKKIYSVAFHFQAAPTDVSTNLEWLQGLHNWSKVTSNRQTFLISVPFAKQIEQVELEAEWFMAYDLAGFRNMLS